MVPEGLRDPFKNLQQRSRKKKKGRYYTERITSEIGTSDMPGEG